MRGNPDVDESADVAMAPTLVGLGPRREFPRDRTVLDLFLERVEIAPDRPALRYRDATMTYGELGRAVNATAAELVAAGVQPRRLIPVLVTDGLEFPTALLGVLRAGAAFVPLDPSWPADRLAGIAAELDPPVVVTAATTAAAMGSAVRTIVMDRAVGAPEPTADLGERRPMPSDLIYGYYTSGSTGTPKCALNRHRGLVNRLTAMSAWFGDGADHIALQNSRSTFDSAMWQVLWPLSSGGQVVLPYRDGILDLERTALTIGEYGATITDFVPSVLAAFVSLLESRPDLVTAVSCLRRMLIGGEAANASVVRRLRRLLPNLLVTNTYGPTECSIGSVFHDVGDHDLERIPLGRAIDNTAAIVLDEARRPVAPNEVGEVYLGGECVGAGYLNDEHRTSSVFVPNPFARIDGALLYRTGDLATYDDEGLLHFVGRLDEQVKIGGVRVELGDVSNAMAAHPMVGDAVAVVLDDADDPTLVCCVTPRSPDQRPPVAQLRSYAAQRLPAELVPHRIMVLESLPVNHNGKVDRRTLAALLAARAPRPDDPSVSDDAPANSMEELLADAWREVLGLRHVSVLVPFREYGGTSLTAYRLAVAVGSRLHRHVPPRDLLTRPTVRAQAAALLADVEHDDPAELDYIVRDIGWLPPKVVLLTGATGFIGTHLLADLLCHSDVELICLVRAADARDGEARLAASLKQYRLTAAHQLFEASLRTGRVAVIAGDLGRVRLGFDEDQFAKLASTVTDVLHAGAMVNFLASYVDHRPANVLGVQELIRLAARSNGCRLHVLSTLSVFPTIDVDEMTALTATHRLPAPDRVAADGYSRSKYVAERLLENVRRSGVPSVVYRLGEVWPHRELGVANPTSVAHNVLYACARTGCVFDTEAEIDFTPVDVLSQFITRCVTGEVRVADGTLHVLWRRPLRFADAFAALAGKCHLDRISYAEFRHRLEILAEPPGSDERLARLRLLLSGEQASPVEFDKMFTATGRYVDARQFERYSAALVRPTSLSILSAHPAPLEALDGYLSSLAAVSIGKQGTHLP